MAKRSNPKSTRKPTTKRRSAPIPVTQSELAISFDDRNANKHDDRSLQAVALSVGHLGAGRSVVVDRDGVLVAGEATFKAAAAAGMNLEYVHSDGSKLVVVVRDDLAAGDPRRTALAIADNQTGRLSDFDYAVLGQQIGKLGEQSPMLVRAVGFSDAELKVIGSGLVAQPGGDAESGGGGSGDGPEMGKPIAVTAEQRGVIDQAVERVRTDEGPDVSEGRALELICGDFLAGA